MIYRAFFTLILERLEAERAHALAGRLLRIVAGVPGVGALLRRALAPRDRRLEVRALGRVFPTPLGVAAGVDKDASWFEGLGALGFGHVEVGTVTALAQQGNPRPRVFRLTADRALLNRLGFPNPGAQVVAGRLGRRTGPPIVGVNVGKSQAAPLEAAREDYRASIERLAGAADYVVVNVSSPNTPGLRELQDVELLRPLLADLRAALADAHAPLLLKIAPDLEDGQLDAIADLACELRLDGIVAVNTTVERTGLVACRELAASIGDGGLSGAPLGPRALEVLRRLYARVGDELVLISVGGIETPEDAWERILAGATLIQAYTGFVLGGPVWPHRINRELGRRLRDAGASSIQALVGAAAGDPHEVAPLEARRSQAG